MSTQTVDREIPPPSKTNQLMTQADAQKLDQMLEGSGLTKNQFLVLRDTIHPNAQTDAAVLMAFQYCKAKNLDPFTKAVHIVPAYSKKHGKMIETVWMGIAALRIIAHRTGAFAGNDDCELGPDVTKKIGSKEYTFPQWAKMTVYRIVQGKKEAFKGPKVYWLEEYATVDKNSDVPNQMWGDRPYGQLEKCAEAAAIRRAFPEETDYTAEEMEGRVIEDTTALSKKEQAALAKAVAQDIAESTVVESEPVDAEVDSDDAPPPMAKVEPTFQEKMAAHARVAEATGASPETVASLEAEAASGISATAANSLMKHAAPNGWSSGGLISYIVSTYSLDKKTWMKQLTDRQYKQVWDYVEANKPE